MQALSTHLDLEVLDPHKLSDDELVQVQIIIQDIFAESSRECMICDMCQRTTGKKELFGSLPTELYRESVYTILGSPLAQCALICPWCQTEGSLRLMHPVEQEMQITRNRINASLEMQTIVWRSNEGEVVGYGEVYVASFDQVYRYELEQHYGLIPPHELRRRISTLLGRDTSIMTVLPFIGILQRYRSSRNFALFLRQFFAQAVFEHISVPGIMEVEKDGPVYRVFRELWWISLNDTDPDFFDEYVEASPHYESSVLVFPNAIELFRTKFSGRTHREVLLRA